MVQKHIAKLLLFVLAVTAHMYFYDPSLLTFMHNVEKASNLQFNDQFLLNSVIWAIGFWGMILFLNSKNRTVRFLCWILFVLSSFIEFIYVRILGESFMMSNIHKLSYVFLHLPTIEIVPLIQFSILTILLIILAFILKPLEITITKTFMVVLSLSLVLILVAHKGVEMVIPTFYLVPILIIYKYTIVAYGAMKSGSTNAAIH